MVLILAPMPDFLMAPLAARYQCVMGTTAEEQASAVSKSAAEIRAIVMTGGATVPLPLLESLPRLEIIAVNGVGYDGVPVETCRKRGIRVTNTPDVLTDDVADLAVALLLMSSRQLHRANRDLHAGAWSAGANRLSQKVSGKRVGILGLGRIGKAIAKRLAAFDMAIGYHGRHAQEGSPWQYFAELESLARWCDFMIVACPGGEKTRHLVGASVLSALGPTGTLINIARGSVVDESALIIALQSGQLGGAALDVFENEPQVPQALLDDARLVLLPHVGSATMETRHAMAELVLGNLEAHFAGAPLLTPVV